jgi:hypothetical protein
MEREQEQAQRPVRRSLAIEAWLAEARAGDTVTVAA